MTPTKDTAGHPDVTEISDLVEGVLAPDRTSSVSGHLDACALCADVQATLEEIRGALGTLPGPARMPADVAGRIDAALAAEALLSAAAEEGTDTAGSEAPVGKSAGSTVQAPHASHVSRETERPANRSGGSAGPRPSTVPTGSGPGRSTGRPLSRRRRSLKLGAVLAAAAAAVGVLVAQPFQEDPVSPAAATFSGRPLEQQVSGLLAESGEAGQASSPQPRTLVRPAVDVPSCVREGINSGEEALAARKGTFEGKTAYLVVLPDPKTDSRVTAYVVDASCITDSSPDDKDRGEVLVQRSYARPSN
ncbi:hypothetical protein [Streptomyces chilikensis]|uniref:hypothetical protein n=1 Tax=Streptomyces chilikensis TaxID=1194079 RepID=UPI000A633083|nr:hypothetical protein [Streptomyces chilikensis]